MVDNRLDVAIGANIQRWRKAAGVSQSDLAKLVGSGWRQQTVVKVEQGTRPLKLAEAIAIANVLRLEVAHIYQGATETEQAAQVHGQAQTVQNRYQKAVEETARLEMDRRDLTAMATNLGNGVPDDVADFISRWSRPGLLGRVAKDAERMVNDLQKGKNDG